MRRKVTGPRIRAPNSVPVWRPLPCRGERENFPYVVVLLLLLHPWPFPSPFLPFDDSWRCSCNANRKSVLGIYCSCFPLGQSFTETGPCSLIGLLLSDLAQRDTQLPSHHPLGSCGEAEEETRGGWEEEEEEAVKCCQDVV